MKILVTVGTQTHSFARLIDAIDLLEGDFFCQVGNSKWAHNHPSEEFVDNLDKLIAKSDIIITHGGVGTIIECLLARKKIIVVPRLAKFNEHVDDHQLEIAEFVRQNNYAFVCEEMSELKGYISKIKTQEFNYYEAQNAVFIKGLNDIIKDLI